MSWQKDMTSNPDWWREIYLQDGLPVAYVEIFSTKDCVYPHAIDAKTHEWMRGGCFKNLNDAKAWAEQIAGVKACQT